VDEVCCYSQIEKPKNNCAFYPRTNTANNKGLESFFKREIIFNTRYDMKMILVETKQFSFTAKKH
jgi:hypothetical protein